MNETKIRESLIEYAQVNVRLRQAKNLKIAVEKMKQLAEKEKLAKENEINDPDDWVSSFLRKDPNSKFSFLDLHANWFCPTTKETKFRR